MRVVYVTDARMPTARAHGAQIARNCEALAQVGAEVTLVYQKVAGRDTPISDYYELQQKVETVGVRGLELAWLRGSSAGRIKRLMLSAYRGAWETSAWLRLLRRKADLFVLRDSTSYLAWYLAKTNRPTLIEYHQPPASLSLKLHRSAVSGRGLKAVVAVTQALGKELQDVLGVKPELVHTLHDGVDVERFDSRTESKTESDELTVLYVGSLLPNRGVGTLIQAARHLPETQVTVVGGVEPELGKCKRDAARLGAENVRFVGHVPTGEVPGFLSRCRVAVLPMTGAEVHTRLHASPLKLFEYMASGAAIVASDLPSVREVVKHGVTAHLVTPDDPESLAKGILQVLGDEQYAKRLSEAARSEVQNYTWDRRARALLSAARLPV